VYELFTSFSGAFLGLRQLAERHDALQDTVLHVAIDFLEICDFRQLDAAVETTATFAVIVILDLIEDPE